MVAVKWSVFSPCAAIVGWYLGFGGSGLVDGHRAAALHASS
jgi:hypothetical protein